MVPPALEGDAAVPHWRKSCWDWEKPDPDWLRVGVRCNVQSSFIRRWHRKWTNAEQTPARRGMRPRVRWRPPPSLTGQATRTKPTGSRTPKRNQGISCFSATDSPRCWLKAMHEPSQGEPNARHRPRKGTLQRDLSFPIRPGMLPSRGTIWCGTVMCLGLNRFSP